jgi:hypothetical protein
VSFEIVRISHTIHVGSWLKFSMYGHTVYIPFHLVFLYFPKIEITVLIFFISTACPLPEKLGLGLKVWEERMQKNILKSPNPDINIDNK